MPLCSRHVKKGRGLYCDPSLFVRTAYPQFPTRLLVAACLAFPPRLHQAAARFLLLEPRLTVEGAPLPHPPEHFSQLT